MGSAAIKPSPAVGRLLRNRRLELRLTLREVSERLEERGERFPTSTLVRVEQGRLDPGIRRLHLLLSLYRIRPDLVADLVELEDRGAEEPGGADPETLGRECVEHLRQGNTAQALAHIFALKHSGHSNPPAGVGRQRAMMEIAATARDIGKFELAKELVEHVLRDSPEGPVLVRAMVLASALWRGWGSSEVAIALVRQAATHVKDDDLELKAWVMHQEARLLVEHGELDAAESAVERLIQLDRKRKGPDTEARALLLRLRVEERRGDLQAAIRCARRVVKSTENGGRGALLAAGLLELGRLLLEAGAVEEGVEQLNGSLSQAMLLGDRYLEFHAHYNLWKAYAAIGDHDRQRFELQAASYFVRFIDDSSEEAREVRTRVASRDDGRQRRRGRPRGRPGSA